jgi:EmrB/QacA subfamily drug resistance transporter
LLNPEESRRRYALLAVSLSSFLTPFMGAAVNVALPSIACRFEMNAVALGWVATSYILAAAVGLVPLGRLADMHGRKRVFVLGNVVFGIGSVLSALAQSGAMLIAARVVQGLGGAMLFGTGTAILTSVFPPEKRGYALGVNVAVVYSGLSLGPTLGGLMTQALGWRSIFWVCVPLAAVTVAMTLWKLDGEWADAKGERFDVPGTLVYAAGLLLLMYGFSLLPGWSGGLAILAGLVGLAGFVLIESRTKCPVLDVSLFRGNRVFVLSNFSALVNYSATSAVGFLVSLYLQYVKGLDARGAGLVLVAAPLMQAVVSPVAGRMSDRVEPRLVASVGMALTAAGLLCLTLLGGETRLWVVVAALAVSGVGFGLFSSPNTNAIMGSVERRDYGIAAGMVATMRMIGQMFSMGIAMLLLAVFVGRVQITGSQQAGLLAGMRVAFAIFAALCVAGVFASLARGKLHSQKVRE